MKQGSRLILAAVLVAAVGLATTVHGGAMFISGDDADESGHCQGTNCGGLYPRVLTMLMSECLPKPTVTTGILAIGINCPFFGGCLARNSLQGWNNPANGGPGVPITFITDPAEIATVKFEDYTILYLPSSRNQLSDQSGISNAQLAALNGRVADIKTYINDNNGRLLALTEGGAQGAYGWLPNPLTYVTQDVSNVDPTPDMFTQFPGSGATAANMDHVAYHTYWTGPAGWSGLYVLAETPEVTIPDPDGLPPPHIPTFRFAPIIVGGCNLNVTQEICDNGIDDDGDGKADHEDPDCWVCGNNWPDPGEECDDGNLLSGDGCDATCMSETCSSAAGAISPLKGVKLLSDTNWTWVPEPNSTDGYRVYYVLVKTELDASQAGKGARGSNVNAALGCETVTQTSLSCADTDGLLPTGTPFFYQVVGNCGGTEGLN